MTAVADAVGVVRSPPNERSELRTTGLSVAFGGVKALDEVDFFVREGEIVGLIGPNGADQANDFAF